MLSLNEKAILVVCCLYILARLGDRYLVRRFAEDVLWEMPWMKWATFDELAVSTRVPKHYLRRVLFALMHTKFVEFEFTHGDAKEQLLEMLTSPNRLRFVELFKYRRVASPKRRRTKITLPQRTDAWIPANA
ncbi:MAG: hypothetical protein KBD06_04475 [Candidatus Pacebacteria bacterium]|nr:hypothetical protein [Candidatus Paceibacterota bacterium]